MKKKTNIACVIAIVIICSCGMGIIEGTPNMNLDISNTYETRGTGIMDRTVEINTNPDYKGQKFTSETYTPCLGLYGVSNISFNEEIFVAVGNASDIIVTGAIEGETVSQKYCQRNYDLGVRQSYSWKGDSTALCYEWITDNRTSVMVVEGKTSGMIDYTILVKDLLDEHKKIYDENFEFKGILGYTIESVIENTTYPGADLDDWLGCP